MSDLQVATDELRTLGGRLEQLNTDLKSQDGKADYGRAQLGHERVVNAMEEFRDNWDDNRDHLADKLGKLSELAIETADGFEEADRELAKEIIKAMEGDG